MCSSDLGCPPLLGGAFTSASAFAAAVLAAAVAAATAAAPAAAVSPGPVTPPPTSTVIYTSIGKRYGV